MILPQPVILGLLAPALLAASVILGMAVFLIEARRVGLPGRRAVLFVAGVGIAAVAGATGWWAIEQGVSVAHVSFNALGQRAAGGVLGALIGAIVLKRLLLPQVSAGTVADCLALAAPFGLALVRLRCLLLGCCHGAATALAWGVRYPPESPPARLHWTRGWTDLSAPSLAVQPLALYFLLLAVGVGVFLWWFRPRRSYSGQLLLLLLALHESGKFLLEFLRDPHDGVVVAMRGASLVVAIAAVGALIVGPLWRRARPALPKTVPAPVL